MPENFYRRVFNSWVFAPFRDPDRGMRLLQWFLPLILFVIATMYEIGEHGMGIFGGAREPFSFNMNAEIFIFGVSGPAATALAVGYVRYLLRQETEIRAQLETINLQLEDIVAERTATLEARNRELAQANAELQQLDQLKSDFVSLVSHELRAPLTVINGGVELALQEADVLPKRTRHTLETILHEANHLTTVVQTILDISRLEAGKIQVTCGPVAVYPLLKNAAQNLLAASGHPVLWEIEPDLPPLWGDEIYTEEILRNLLSNADKYSPAGSPIHVHAWQNGKDIQIAITDHGPGIAPPEQAHIFEQFYRSHKGENTPTGWGLGLYFAQKLIATQEGRITIESPVWKAPQAPGTRFVISLPIATAPDEEILAGDTPL
ncbi:MAG: hypothetical protein Fur0018_03260 [Anaerolineales bacterium]